MDANEYALKDRAEPEVVAGAEWLGKGPGTAGEATSGEGVSWRTAGEGSLRDAG